MPGFITYMSTNYLTYSHIIFGVNVVFSFHYSFKGGTYNSTKKDARLKKLVLKDAPIVGNL